MVEVSAKDSVRKSKLKKQILNLNDGSYLDFTAAYLNGLSIDRLKHILLYARTMRVKKKS